MGATNTRGSEVVVKIRTAVLGTVAALVVSLVSFAPAEAAPAFPTISNLNAATPGHVTGTVSSNGPFVIVTFGGTYINNDEMVALPTTDGSAAFDLETWGHRAPLVVAASTCPTAAYVDQIVCSPWSYSAQFVPTDVRPTITFSDDTQVGPLDSVTITASDTGGGRLWAVWYHPSGSSYIELDKNGATTITADRIREDASGYMRIWRCAAVRDFCTEFDAPIAKAYDIQQKMKVTAGEISTITYEHRVRNLPIQANRAGTYELSYDLAEYQTENLIPGTRKELGGTVQAGSTLSLPVDGALVPDGTYTLIGTLRVNDPTFGTYETRFKSGAVAVRRTRPTADTVKVQRHTIYPRIRTAKYPGDTEVTFTRSEPFENLSAKVLNSANQVVMAAGLAGYGSNSVRFQWSARLPDGGAPPPGIYTVVLVDGVGNSSEIGGQVRVSGQYLVKKVSKRTLTASGSLDGKFVGKCSTLRRPSLRGWAGSLGFYANTRCRTQTWKASGVSTLHYTRIPAAAELSSVVVTVNGGAAKSKPRSLGVLRYLNSAGKWQDERTVTAKLGNHNGYPGALKRLVQKGDYFVWGFYTGWRYRYDVRNFTVTFRYYVLSAS